MSQMEKLRLEGQFKGLDPRRSGKCVLKLETDSMNSRVLVHQAGGRLQRLRGRPVPGGVRLGIPSITAGPGQLADTAGDSAPTLAELVAGAGHIPRSAEEMAGIPPAALRGRLGGLGGTAQEAGARQWGRLPGELPPLTAGTEAPGPGKPPEGTTWRGTARLLQRRPQHPTPSSAQPPAPDLPSLRPVGTGGGKQGARGGCRGPTLLLVAKLRQF